MAMTLWHSTTPFPLPSLPPVQSPDGAVVASAAADETLRFWRVFGDAAGSSSSSSETDSSLGPRPSGLPVGDEDRMGAGCGVPLGLPFASAGKKQQRMGGAHSAIAIR